jgi:hypothetical protein
MCGRAHFGSIGARLKRFTGRLTKGAGGGMGGLGGAAARSPASPPSPYSPLSSTALPAAQARAKTRQNVSISHHFGRRS